MDALKFWRLAGRALLKDDSLQQFQQVMETHVVPKLTALGRMQEAAKALQQVGECLLSGGQVDAACAAFERAISLFEADDLGGRGAQVCREQIAQAAIDRQQWKLASTQYAAMHAKDMDHPILKRMGTPKALRSGMSHGRFFPSVRLFFFSLFVVLCACASGDTVDATRKLEAFEEMDTCFNPTSQDFQLAQGVLTAVIDANIAGFMDCMSVVVARVAARRYFIFRFHFFFFAPLQEGLWRAQVRPVACQDPAGSKGHHRARRPLLRDALRGHLCGQLHNVQLGDAHTIGWRAAGNGLDGEHSGPCSGHQLRTLHGARAS